MNVKSIKTMLINNTEIADALAHIDDLIANCESRQENVNIELKAVNIEISDLKQQIDSIRESLSLTKHFNEAEYAELSHYIFEGSYTDEYVTVTDTMTYSEKFAQMKILYDRAEARLERISQPTQEFNIDVENFIFVKEFKHWSNQLETGCLINVELETDANLYGYKAHIAGGRLIYVP